MGLYADHIEPRLVSLACGAGTVVRYRDEVVPLASGRVLELGFGSGHNLAHYDAARVDHLYALEPHAPIARLAEERLRASPISATPLRAGAEAIPLPDDSIDTVVVTFTLCTVPDLGACLREARRVLDAGGRLLFAEHGLAPDPSVATWQQRIEPVWGRIAGGCHLTRDVPAALRSAGFTMADLNQAYAKGAPRIAGYVSHGTASLI